jgi:hypothetical protein
MPWWISLNLHYALFLKNLNSQDIELYFMTVVLTGYWQLFKKYTIKTATDVTSWLGYKMARPSTFSNGNFSRDNINTVFFHYNLKNLLFDNLLKWSHLYGRCFKIKLRGIR